MTFFQSFPHQLAIRRFWKDEISRQQSLWSIEAYATFIDEQKR